MRVLDLGLMMLLIVGVMIGAPAFAEHDYFAPVVIWNEAPRVCLADIPSEYKYMALKASMTWREAMMDYNDDSDLWNYQVFVRSVNNTVDCSIIISHIGARYLDQEFEIVGNTDCNTTQGRCYIKINPDWNDGTHYHDTLVHEMGHALGLSHRLPYDGKGWAAVVMSNDIMFQHVKDHLHITKASLDALIFFDAAYPLIANYTIPHNDTWKDLYK